MRWGAVPPQIRRIAASFPQSSLVAGLARLVTGGRLRILAFHGVTDLDQFELLLSWICRNYRPVSASDVSAALSGKPLPRFPVWFTFDDGLASTFRAGEVLAKYGVSATVFVCPGVMGQRKRLWFQTFDEAVTHGLIGEHPGAALQRLKKASDRSRREEIKQLENHLEAQGVSAPDQPGVVELRRWMDQGHSVGNHTWDHPNLDTCGHAEQLDQVHKAHEALVAWGVQPAFFAYPNGNFAAPAAEAARSLGYTASLLFDHRLSSLGVPSATSRLRIAADITPRRGRSILSGAHSAMFRIVAG